MLGRIRELNKFINIMHVEDPEFEEYGRLIEGYDFTELVDYMQMNADIPKQGNIYVPSCPEMESTEIGRKTGAELFGGQDIQIGYCNGKNSKLNGMEYHKSREINVASTDLIVFLGKVQDIKDNTYQSNRAKCFYIPRGTAFEMYDTTLHYGPLRVEESGFKNIVILPRGTNLPLDCVPGGKGELGLLFATNKWLMVHPDMINMIERGAKEGIKGQNLEILL